MAYTVKEFAALDLGASPPKPAREANAGPYRSKLEAQEPLSKARFVAGFWMSITPRDLNGSALSTAAHYAYVALDRNRDATGAVIVGHHGRVQIILEGAEAFDLEGTQRVLQERAPAGVLVTVERAESEVVRPKPVADDSVQVGDIREWTWEGGARFEVTSERTTGEFGVRYADGTRDLWTAAQLLESRLLSRATKVGHAVPIAPLAAIRTMRALSDAFAALWRAMTTPEGGRLCTAQLVADTLRLCPADMNQEGWRAALLAKVEADDCDPPPWFMWQVCAPRDYADETAVAIRRAWGGSADRAYRRAVARPSPPAGPWMGRRGSRR